MLSVSSLKHDLHVLRFELVALEHKICGLILNLLLPFSLVNFYFNLVNQFQDLGALHLRRGLSIHNKVFKRIGQ